MSEPPRPEDTAPAAPPDPTKRTNPPPVPIDWNNLPSKVIETLSKRMAIRDGRDKVLAELNKERERTAAAAQDAKAASTDWQNTIQLDTAARTALEGKIKAAEGEVANARKTVSDQRDKVTATEAAAKTAEEAASAEEKKYADTQRELGQLAAEIKAGMARIDRLRAEVKHAFDLGDWSRAYYKNYRLREALEVDESLRDATKRQNALIKALEAMEDGVYNEGNFKQGSITKAKQDAATAKDVLAKQQNLLKALEAELKQKESGLETAIDNFL